MLINPKNVVTVSRKWDNPEISHSVTVGGIQISIDLNDYLTALLAEMGNPTMLVTKAQLGLSIRKASGKVLQGIKDETAKIV